MSKFDSIRPYEDHEVEKVLLDLTKDKDVIKTILTVNKNNWLQKIPMIRLTWSLTDWYANIASSEISRPSCFWAAITAIQSSRSRTTLPSADQMDLISEDA